MEEGAAPALPPPILASSPGLRAWRPAFLGPLLLLLVVVVYHAQLDAPLTSDARFLTVRNTDVVEATGIARVWTGDYFQGAITPEPYRSGYYRPVTNALFWLEYRWAGDSALFYNLMEMLLHGVNALLIALLVSSFWGDRRVGALAGLIFAVHPVHAFAAAEPAARADVLFATFYLLALLVFDRALARPRGDRPPVALLGTVGVLYLLSVLSKEMGITLPAALALLVALRHAQGKVQLKRLLWTLPAWALAAPYLIWRFVFLELEPSRMGYLEVHAPGSLLLAGLKTIPVHLSRIVVPLGPTYPELNPELLVFVSGWATDPLTYAALAVLGALVMGALLWRRQPQVAFCCAFFLVSLSPLLKVDNIGGTLDTDVILAQERWIYLPALAIVALLARGAFALAERARAMTGPRSTWVSFAALTGVAVLLSGAAAQHAGRHTDPYSLLKSLYLIPEHRLGRMQRANRLMLYANLVALPMGDGDDAEARARAAIELVPDSPLVAVSVSRVMAARDRWEEVRRLVGPWLSPSPEGMRAMHETNFRVYDDLNRVSHEIPILLARAEVHLGRPAVAARLLCEAMLRGGAESAAASVWSEIWQPMVAQAPPLPEAAEDGGGCARWTQGLEA